MKTATKRRYQQDGVDGLTYPPIKRMKYDGSEELSKGFSVGFKAPAAIKPIFDPESRIAGTCRSTFGYPSVGTVTNLKTGVVSSSPIISPQLPIISPIIKDLGSKLKRHYEPENDDDLLASPAKKSKSGFKVHSKASPLDFTAPKYKLAATPIKSRRNSVARVPRTRKSVGGRASDGNKTTPAGRVPKKGTTSSGSIRPNRPSLSTQVNARGASGAYTSIRATRPTIVSNSTLEIPVAPGESNSKMLLSFFGIHEDTKVQEKDILLEHSTRILDISDDGSEVDVGKENVAPVGHVVSYEPRKMMTGEARTILGELAPEHYYGKGCDLTTFFYVQEDREEELQAITAFNGAHSLSKPKKATEAEEGCKKLLEQLVAKKLIPTASLEPYVGPAIKKSRSNFFVTEDTLDDTEIVQDDWDFAASTSNQILY